MPTDTMACSMCKHVNMKLQRCTLLAYKHASRSLPSPHPLHKHCASPPMQRQISGCHASARPDDEASLPPVRNQPKQQTRPHPLAQPASRSDAVRRASSDQLESGFGEPGLLGPQGLKLPGAAGSSSGDTRPYIQEVRAGAAAARARPQQPQQLPEDQEVEGQGDLAQWLMDNVLQYVSDEAGEFLTGAHLMSTAEKLHQADSARLKGNEAFRYQGTWKSCRKALWSVAATLRHKAVMM